MRLPLSFIILATCLAALTSPVCLAGDRPVSIDSDPQGAQVEVNGSIVCSTPCSVKVPGHYFGAKHTEL